MIGAMLVECFKVRGYGVLILVTIIESAQCISNMRSMI